MNKRSKRRKHIEPSPARVVCSFCGSDERALMITGLGTVAICCCCLELCAEMANEFFAARAVSRSLTEAGY